MKKAISLFLVLVLCLSLCACGSGAPHNTTPAETTPAYDKQNLESILAYIATVAESTEVAIEKEVDALTELLDNSYENYKNNQDSISTCYATIVSAAKNSYSTFRIAAVDAYKCIASEGVKGMDNFSVWDSVMDDVYDALDDADRDIYAALNGAYDEISDVCTDSIQDADDILGEEEVYALMTAKSDFHSAQWQEMYKVYRAVWSDVSADYCAVWAGFLDGKTDVDAILKAYYEEIAATEATQPVETTTDTVPENLPSDIATAAEGYDRLFFTNEAFQNYEIWQDTQDGSMYIVNLKNLTKIDIIPLSMYDSVSEETITIYSVKLVHNLLLPTIGQYLPYFTPSFADPWNGYYAVDFGGKVAGLWGFSCSFAIAPDDSSLTEETVWVAAPLGSMCADDYLGYQETSVEYSTLSTLGDVPNWVDCLANSVSNETAGFAIMPQLAYQANKASKESAYSTIVLTDVGGFTTNYDFAVLHFDNLEHVAEFIIPQWEAYENQ